MLVLTRTTDEIVEIGGSSGIPLIKVMIVKVTGDKVRLGFDAPSTVVIHRSEIARSIEENGVRNGA